MSLHTPDEYHVEIEAATGLTIDQVYIEGSGTREIIRAGIEGCHVATLPAFGDMNRIKPFLQEHFPHLHRDEQYREERFTIVRLLQSESLRADMIMRDIAAIRERWTALCMLHSTETEQQKQIDAVAASLNILRDASAELAYRVLNDFEVLQVLKDLEPLNAPGSRRS